MGVLKGLAEQSGSVFSIYTPLAPSPGMGGPRTPFVCQPGRPPPPAP